MAMQGRARIEVGGRVFVTGMETLEKAGKESNLYQTVSQSGQGWFDRDPDVFHVLLNMLRTGVVYPKPESLAALDRLIDEARFYGVEEFLRNAWGCAPLSGIDAEKAKPVIPSGIDVPRTLAAGEDGSLWVGHGSKITVYDWALRKQRTTLTELGAVDVMHRLTDDLVTCGASDLPGLHVYDVTQGVHSKSVSWTDANDPRVYNAIVHAIASNDSSVFASFESGQQLDNAVLMMDKTTLQVTREIGRQNGQAAHTKFATKLQWLPAKNLLFVGSVHGGSFGFSGYMRLWDLRADKIVWDWKEPNFQRTTRGVEQQDVFADMVVDEDLGAIFKVGVQSGAVSLADLRNLDTQDPWLELVEAIPLEKVVTGPNKKLLSYNKQVFLAREADVEVWAEVPLAESFRQREEKEYWETSFRRNLLEHRRHPGQMVTQMVAGGQRLFVARKDFQGVEVWETRK
ncbi:hypothetical protein M758_3G160100 [Ceratodon purpureus]|nr:hypothetical protein M758_3G160100 [Ceratodon purpureus]